MSSMSFETFSIKTAPPVQPDEIIIRVLEESDRNSVRRQSLGGLFSDRGLLSNGKSSTEKSPALRYVDVSCQLKRTRYLLRRCSGTFLPNGVTAILGPSGAGKTTLLEVIAQRAHILKAKNLTLSGTVSLGQYRMTPSLFRQQCGYVPQIDALWPVLTVREHFHFAFVFKYGEGLGSEPIIDEVIALLGLSQCEHTIVGGAFVKGCSGGQRRRTSVGTQIICQPSLMLLDEPTSGLDSSAALAIVESLRYLAGRFFVTVGTTIHQPSTYVWEMFDQVVLLSNGATAYVGKPDAVLPHLKKVGHEPSSTLINPADYALELMCSDFTTSEVSGEHRVAQILEEWERSPLTPVSNTDVVDCDPDKLGMLVFCRQTGILVQRKFKIATLDPLMFKGRLLLCMYIGTLVGFMNMNIKFRHVYFMDWLKIFSLEGGLMIFGSVLIIPQFASDILLLTIETSNGMYGVVADSLSLCLWDVVNGFVVATGFIAPLHFITNQPADSYLTIMAAVWAGVCVFDGISYCMCCLLLDKHFLVAMGWSMVVFVLLWLANGFYISVSVMPLWTRWLYWVSPMRYMNDIISMAMIRGVSWGPCKLRKPCFNMHTSGNPYQTSASTGDILKTLSYKVDGYPDIRFYETDTRRAWLILVSMGILCRLVGLYFIQRKLMS